MPRTITGDYSLPVGTLVSTGDIVLPSQHNPGLQDVAAAIMGSLSRSGRGGMLANLKMGGNRVVGAGPGIDPTDLATVDQAQRRSLDTASALAGIADAAIPQTATLAMVGGDTRGTLITDASLSDADVAKHPRAIIRNRDGKYLRRDQRWITPDMFGADPSGFSDSQPAFQAASDYLYDFNALQAGGGEAESALILTGGKYRFNSTFLRRNAAMIGLGAATTSNTIFWGGASGGTLMAQANDADNRGNLSHGRLERIFFTSGDNLAGKLYDLSTANPAFVIDENFRITECYFERWSDVAIQLRNWINLHWTHLRLQGSGNYAIRAMQNAEGSSSSFILGPFTYDNKPGEALGTGRGFLRLETSGSANIGNVKIWGGRLELNGAWTDERAIVSHFSNSQFLTANIVLADMNIATNNVASAVPNVLVHIADPIANWTSLVGRDLAFTDFNAWRAVGGNGAAGQPNPFLRPFNPVVQAAFTAIPISEMVATPPATPTSFGMPGQYALTDAGRYDCRAVNQWIFTAAGTFPV